jgi:hypothetical protein
MSDSTNLRGARCRLLITAPPKVDRVPTHTSLNSTYSSSPMRYQVYSPACASSLIRPPHGAPLQPAHGGHLGGIARDFIDRNVLWPDPRVAIGQDRLVKIQPFDHRPGRYQEYRHCNRPEQNPLDALHTLHHSSPATYSIDHNDPGQEEPWCSYFCHLFCGDYIWQRGLHRAGNGVEYGRVRATKRKLLRKATMAVSNPCKPKKPRLRGCVSSGFAWTCAQVPSWRQGGSIFAHWEQNYKALYPHRYDGPHFDWPPYRPVREGRDQVEHVRFEYAALVSMCDHYLGQILNSMDRYGLWDDTMLIVNTDHGFLLGEHDWWAKCVQPFYSEVARTPLFIWDPRCACQGERRSALVQTIDLPATLLDYFGLDLPASMQGAALRAVVAADRPVRAAALFGLHGGHVNVTDGRYVYMRGPHSPDNEPLLRVHAHADAHAG